MPPIKIGPQEWFKALGRALVVGAPNSRKTTSLMTWPEPVIYLIYPGEKGLSSLQEGVTAFHWSGSLDKISSSKLIEEVEVVTFEILAGKHGPIKTFAGDGLHKLVTLYVDKASGGALRRGEEFGAQAYGRAYEEFLSYLDRVMRSPVDYAVFTCWDGREADNPELGSKGPTHIYPDLPGKLAKRIMGEFSVVLYAEVSAPTPSGKPGEAPTPGKGTWQLQPSGKVWGAGVKIPQTIASKLPYKVEQDWKKLEPLLRGDKG